MKTVISFGVRAMAQFARRRLPFAAAMVVLAVTVFALSQHLMFVQLAHAQVASAPFTMQQEISSFNQDNPDGYVAFKITVAKRSDGARAEESRILDPSGRQIGETRKLSYPDGREWLAFDEIASVIEDPQPPAWLVAMRKAKLLNPPSNCVSPGQTLAGYQQVEGFEVALVQMPAIAGEPGITVSLAPKLGCEMLQSDSQVKQPDGTLKQEGTRFISLTVGEPNGSLFEIPPNYLSVMPSVAFHKEAAFHGQAWDSLSQSTAARWDAIYTAHLRGEWGTPPKTQTSDQSSPNPPTR